MSRNDKIPGFWTMPDDRQAEFKKLPACLRQEYAVPDGVTAEMLTAAMTAYWDVLYQSGDGDPNWGDMFAYVWAAMEGVRNSGDSA